LFSRSPLRRLALASTRLSAVCLGPLGFTPRGAGQSEGAARAALERSNTSALTQYRLPLDHQLQRLADEIDLAFAEFG
jgi:hypothetical protein